MSLPLRIATRFIKTNKNQTILIVLGIAIGISVQVFIGLLIQGLQKDLINSTIGTSPHITITSEASDSFINGWQDKTKKINSNFTEVNSVASSAEAPGFMNFKGLTEGILLRGFTIKEADEIYKMSERLIEGQLPIGVNQVIIGKDMAEQLDIDMGDSVEINNFQGVEREMQVVGIYDFQVMSINNSWVITNIETALGFFNMGDAVSSIQITVEDVFKADELGERIGESIGNNELAVVNWKDQNQQLLSGLQGQSVSSIIIQVFVMLAVVLSIASVLAITVMQKSRQIGILKAMGINDRSASLVFLYQGLLLGAMGAVLGVLVGLCLIFLFTVFAVNPDGTPVVNVYINYGFIVLSVIIAMAAAVVASLLPARKSSQLDPIEVIKNG